MTYSFHIYRLTFIEISKFRFSKCNLPLPLPRPFLRRTESAWHARTYIYPQAFTHARRYIQPTPLDAIGQVVAAATCYTHGICSPSVFRKNSFPAVILVCICMCVCARSTVGAYARSPPFAFHSSRSKPFIISNKKKR